MTSPGPTPRCAPAAGRRRRSAFGDLRLRSVRGAQATRADRAAGARARGTRARARSREAREPVAGRRPGAGDRGRVGGGDRGTRPLDAVRAVRGRISCRRASGGGCGAARGRCAVRAVRRAADRVVPDRQTLPELASGPRQLINRHKAVSHGGGSENPMCQRPFGESTCAIPKVEARASVRRGLR